MGDPEKYVKMQEIALLLALARVRALRISHYPDVDVDVDVGWTVFLFVDGSLSCHSGMLALIDLVLH